MTCLTIWVHVVVVIVLVVVAVVVVVVVIIVVSNSALAACSIKQMYFDVRHIEHLYFE